MKFYLTLKDLDVIDNSYRLGLDQYFANTGRNVGNLVFRAGLSSIISDISEYKRITLSDLTNDPNIYTQATQVIVSCANWLGDSAMHDRVNATRLRLFEKFNCPVIPFGIGIQSSLSSESVEFGKNTLEFAKLLGRQCPQISARCSLTKSTLARYGIDNVVVTGCPSNFINLNLIPDSYKRVKGPKLHSKKISCLISEATSGNDLTDEFIPRIFSILENTPSKYALQVMPLIELIYGAKDAVPPLYSKNSIYKSDARTLNFLKDKSVVFSSVPEWLFFARRFDLCFGMRMHGSMIGLQSGVPTVIIFHDSRTKALADEMNIPRISIEDFCTIEPDQIYKQIHDIFFESVNNYFSRRKELSSVFLNFLKDAGLQPSSDFQKYVES